MFTDKAFIRLELIRLYDLIVQEDKNSIAYNGLLSQIIYFENRIKEIDDKLKSVTRIEWQKDANKFE